MGRQFIYMLMVCLMLFLQACSGSFSSVMKKGQVKQTHFSQTLDVEIVKGLMIVPVTIHGEKYRFLLDTGAPSAISEELQAQFTFDKLQSNVIRDSQKQRKKLLFVSIDELFLNEIAFENIAVFVSDFKKNPILKCLQLDGILGSNMMRHCNWEIDFSSQQLTLTDQQLIPVDTSQHSYAFQTDHQYDIILQLHKDSIRLSNVKLDYGSNGSLSVRKKAFESLQNYQVFQAIREKKGMKQSGLYGKRTKDNTAVGLMKNWHLGALELPSLKVSASDNNLLGTDVLSQYKVVIDWRTKQLQFRDLAKPVEEKAFTGFGFQIAFDGNQTYVISVLQDGAADKAGIEVGTVLKQINEYPLYTESDFCNYIYLDSKELSFMKLEIVTDDIPKTVTLERERIFDE